MKLLALAFVLLALAGCAVPQPAPVSPAPPGAPPAQKGASAKGAPAAATTNKVDSLPSPEALAVLATIPEPLGTAANPAATGGGAAKPAAAAGAAAGAGAAATAPKSIPAPAAAFDSLRVDTQSEGGNVPVPTPTEPLGAAAVAPAVAPVVAAAPAAPDTCWRIQVGAPSERAKGKSLRDAAESLLMVPMIVDHEAGRYKVRSRDCLSHTAAESLRERANASGFKGVFLVRVPGTP